MMYIATKKGKHPITDKPIEKGETVELFHQIGDQCPFLTRRASVARENIDNEIDIGGEEIEENDNPVTPKRRFFK